MAKNKSGFTIVELLVVIVIIAILAAISIVAYSGIQGRARDNLRISALASIEKALELYKTTEGAYPPSSGTPSTGWGTCTASASYSHSFATDGTWMKPLIDAKTISKVPVDPVNDCTYYFRYIRIGPGSYGCPTTTNTYVLFSINNDGAAIPGNAIISAPAGCTGWPASYISASNRWVFAKTE